MLKKKVKKEKWKNILPWGFENMFDRMLGSDLNNLSSEEIDKLYERFEKLFNELEVLTRIM